MHLILFTFFFKSLFISDAEIFHNDTVPAPGFGLFSISVQSVETCTKEPDKYLKIEFKRKVFSANKEIFSWSIKAERDFRIVKSVIAGDVMKNEKYIKVFHQTSNNPCSSKYFRPQLPINGIKNISECLISKGTFQIDLDINGNFHRVIGSKFFHGVTRTLTEFTTDSGGYCVLVIAMSIPVDKKKKIKS